MIPLEGYCGSFIIFNYKYMCGYVHKSAGTTVMDGSEPPDVNSGKGNPTWVPRKWGGAPCSQPPSHPFSSYYGIFTTVHAIMLFTK